MSKHTSSTPEIKPLGRTNSGSAIVFDPVAQRITTAKVSRLENHKPIKTAPKWFNHVEIYDEGEFKRLVATLNLGKLGWAANMKRLCGKCNDIYMMEMPDELSAPMATAA
ncbi:MAG: hypothetical protein ALECFALPRED_005470 [Alectoria fallacina]|uniref:Uncharacterized protein n=1 Tax=Alectoria fallacina TaxID=1903189 RepID=A0A8H3FVM6_9LECA|nr:MAG: hypothetical protein ALECFALPRED_005470 [Alectoria fallacina]